MRELLGLAFSVALPMIAGTLWVRALSRQDAPYRNLIGIGYGYIVGLFGVTVAMRVLDFIGQPWSVPWIAVPVVVLAGVAYWCIRSPIGWRAGRAAFDAFTVLPQPARALFVVLLVLTGLRVLLLGLEVVVLPLLPYDALAQWATKSRVWYEYGRIAPFVSASEWSGAAGTMHFTDTHPEYPGTVPLFQVWTALCLGRWDESLINLAWPVGVVALGVAFYAQMRRLEISAVKAMFGAYVLLSLPYLTIHVALAGYADIFVAIAYGLAAMSLWQWTMTRQRDDAILAVVMAIVCASLKQEGLLWVLTLICGGVVALNRRLGLAMTVFLAAAAVLYGAFGPSELQIFGRALRTRYENVSLPVYQHFFVMDDWHLFWYAVVAVIVVNGRLVLGQLLAPMTVTMLAASAFIFVVFFFSSASAGVDNENLASRLPLHLVPALLFYVALILRERATRHHPKIAELQRS